MPDETPQDVSPKRLIIGVLAGLAIVGAFLGIVIGALLFFDGGFPAWFDTEVARRRLDDPRPGIPAGAVVFGVALVAIVLVGIRVFSPRLFAEIVQAFRSGKIRR